MKVLYFLDSTSPIAQDWVSNASASPGVDVRVVCSRTGRILTSCSGMASTAVSGTSARKSRRLLGQLKQSRAANLYFAGRAFRHARRVLVAESLRFRPDIVHALRLTYEGLAASSVRISGTLVVSIWGNDFTLHGARSITRQLIQSHANRFEGLTADCDRDIGLAQLFGFSVSHSVVLPGSLGVPDLFFTSKPSSMVRDFASGRRVVLYPRGIRPYAHPETILSALERLSEQRDDFGSVFVGIPLSHPLRDRIQASPISDRLLTLPPLDRATLSEVMAASYLAVSPTSHDGTPNSVLESISAGCLPVVSRLESIQSGSRTR